MSPSPTNDAAVAGVVDDAPGYTAVSDQADPSTPVKRGRGRPKGSKNKKAGDPTAAAGPSSPEAKRKRGRPPKPKPEGEDASKPKRPRGRPPKNPKPIGDEDNDDDQPPKKKRGRPAKTAD